MEKWENPQCLSEHLLPPHPWFAEERVSLGGNWRFLGCKPGEPLPQGWEDPAFSDKGWSRMPVPGMWTKEEHAGFRVGLYRKNFLLSGALGNRQTILELEYAPDCALVWVNGTYIGTARGRSACAEFDITAALRPEKNTVALLIPAELSPASGAPGGIPGNISIYTRPARCITDIRTEVRWQNGSNPLLLVRAAAQNADGCSVKIALMDGMQVRAYCESKIIDGFADTVLECRDIALWNPSAPALCRIGVILLEGNNLLHTRELTIGLRRAELIGGILQVNGVRQTLFGTDYCPLDQASGCVRSPEELEQDLTQIRSHNFNIISLTAPAPRALYDICDRIGLYVSDACGIVQTEENRTLVQHLCGRLSHQRGFHPSILHWPAPMQHPGILPANAFRVLSNPTAEQVNRHCAGEKIALICRFSEISGMDGFVEQIRSLELFCGGFWKQYRDSDGSGQTGFVGSDGQCRTQFREAKYMLRPVQCSFDGNALTVRNCSTFRNLKDYDFRYCLTRDGAPVVEKEIVIDAPPGGAASIPLETRYDIYKPGRYHLNTLLREEENGPILAMEQWEAGVLKHIYDENPGGAIREEAGSILLKSQHNTYTISRSSGYIEQILSEQQSLLIRPLYPVFTLQESAGFRIPNEWDNLTLRGMKRKPYILEVDHMTRTVSASFHLGTSFLQTYRLFTDGSVTVELRVRTGRSVPKCIGFSCALPGSFNCCQWFGLGPDDSDGGVNTGRFFGLHQQAPSPAGSGFKDSVYAIQITNARREGLHLRSEEGLRFSYCATDSDRNTLTLLLPLDEPPKAHTTYHFSFTLQGIK